MEMTPRERWLALLERKTPDRVPTDYQATEEVTARLRRDLGCADTRRSTASSTLTPAASSSRSGAVRPDRDPRPTCGASSIARCRMARAIP